MDEDLSPPVKSLPAPRLKLASCDLWAIPKVLSMCCRGQDVSLLIEVEFVEPTLSSDEKKAESSRPWSKVGEGYGNSKCAPRPLMRNIQNSNFEVGGPSYARPNNPKPMKTNPVNDRPDGNGPDNIWVCKSNQQSESNQVNHHGSVPDSSPNPNKLIFVRFALISPEAGMESKEEAK